MAGVCYAGMFVAVARKLRVQVGEDGQKICDELFALLIDNLSAHRHHILQHVQNRAVGFSLLFEQGVALFQRLVITNEGVEVGGTVLHDDHVHKAPPFFAAA